MADNPQNENQPQELQALKAQVDEEAKQRKQLEADLEAVYKDLLQEIPEDKKELIPNLPIASRVIWLRSALKRGVFAKETKPQVQVDQSRPKITPETQINLDNLKPEQKMAIGYKTARA